MKKLPEYQFVETVVEQLERESRDHSPDIQSKLDSARMQALAQLQAQSMSEAEFVSSLQTRLAAAEELTQSAEQQLNTIRMSALRRASYNNESLLGKLKTVYQQVFPSRLRVGQALVATACLTIIVSSVFVGINQNPETYDSPDNFALAASGEEFELIENLDFYLWLADNELLN